MTASVPNQLVYSYSGDGSTQIFSYPVRFLDDAELVVVLEASDGTQTVKTLTTHYTVSGAGEANGGSVTMLTAPAAGETLYIYRSTAATQSVDLTDNNRSPAATVEEQLDRFALGLQDLKEAARRTYRTPAGETDKTIEVVAEGHFLKADASGNLVDGGSATDISEAQTNAAAAAASASAAAASASAAASSATAAASSATAAASSATDASTSATEAAASAASIDPASIVHKADTDASTFGFVLDEDDMASDSATKLPTQQSVNQGKLQKVATRTDMADLSGTTHPYVYLYEAGREGVFKWDSSDISALVTVDTEEGVYVAPSSDTTGASGAWVRQYDGVLNAKWFGAAGSGSGDDKDALVAWISLASTTGDALYLPTGNYRITATLPLGAVLTNHFYMFGDGKYKSIIQCDFASSQNGMTIGTFGTVVGYGVSIRDIGIVGIGSKNISTGLKAAQLGNIEVRDCLVLYANIGMQFDACYGFKALHNTIQNTTTLGLWATNKAANNSRIEGNGLYTGAAGLVISDGADNFYAASNEISGFTSAGFEILTGCSAGTFLSNYVEGNGANWFFAGTVKNLVMSGNWFGAATVNTHFASCDGVTFDNNVLYNSNYDINATTCTNLTIGNNVLLGTATLPSMGVQPNVQFTALTTDFTGSNSTTAQPVFSSTQDTFTLEASTSYEFQAEYHISRSAGTISHTVSLLFGGTATFTSIGYLAQVTNPSGNSLAAVQQIWISAATATAVTAANTSATEDIVVKLNGRLRVNAAGTIIPQFKYDAAPGGAPTIKANSAFKIWRMGSDTVASSGRVG